MGQMRRASTPWQRALACASALLTLVLFFFSAHAQELQGKIILVQGEVLVASSPQGPWVRAHKGMSLAEGDIVATRQGARAALLFQDQTQVQLHGQTRIQIRRSGKLSPLVQKAMAGEDVLKAPRSLYKLFGGRVWIRALHPVDWEMGSVMVGIRGTDMSLLLDEAAGEGVIWVLAGLVHVSHPSGQVTLGPRQQASVSPTRPPTVESLRLRPAETVQWILRHPVWVSSVDVPLYGEAAWPEALLPGLEARDKGDLETGLELCLKRPFDPMARLLEAWIYLDQGNWEEAQKTFVSLPSHLPLRWAGLALGRIQKGFYQEAREILREGRAHWGQSRLLSCLWGIASLGMGDMAEARRHLGSPDPSEEELPALLMAQRALMALAWNESAEAQRLSDKALNLNPDSPTAQLLRGVLLRSKGDLEGALGAVSKALQRDPRYLPALIQAAELCWGLERSKEARAFLDRAGGLSPGNPSVLLLTAYMDLARGEWTKAKERLETVLEQDPFSSEAHIGLGILEMRKGSPHGALEEFLAASLVEPMASLPLSYLGKALHQLGRSREALLSLERAAELDPMDPTPYLYQALILRDLHRPSEAVQALESSMARNNNRSVYRSRFLLDQDRAVRNVDLAQAYKELGLLARAKAHAIFSVKEDPANSSAHLFLSTPFREEGKARAGIRELLKAQMLAPANVNTFNTFHDYTVMFEGPRVQGELEGGAGELGLRNSNLFLQGGTSRAAGDLLVWNQEEKGFHKENHMERDLYWRTDWKISLDSSQELLLRWGSMLWARGDHRGDADAQYVQDPYLAQKGHIHTATLGYRVHLGPRQELLSYGIWSTQGFRLEDQLWFPLPPAIEAHTDLNWGFSEEHFQAGLLHMGTWGSHRWEWGIHGARGRESLKSRVLTRFRYGGSLLGRVMQDKEMEVPTFFWEIHAGDVWEVMPDMFLEGCLNFQTAGMGSSPPVISDEQEKRVSLGPRLGLVWKAGPRDFLRLGAAKYLESPYTQMEGLQPVEVAGFALGEDTPGGSLNWEAKVAWDRAWSRSLFTHLEVGLRKHRTWEQAADVRGFQARTLWDWQAQGEVECLISSTVSLTGRYGYRNGDWEEVEVPPGIWPGESWTEHRGVLELRWVHPAGWKLLLRETGVLQLGELGAYGRRQNAYWTDLELEKLFWGRRASVKFVARNVLDQPFRLRTWELISEKGIPARQISIWVRFLF